MDEKTRGWSEVFNDALSLVWTAFTSPKGLELLDGIVDLLDAPIDPFPNVQGLSFEDDVPKPTVDDILRQSGALTETQYQAQVAAATRAAQVARAAQASATPIQGETPKAQTHAEILARRRAKAGNQ